MVSVHAPIIPHPSPSDQRIKESNADSQPPTVNVVSPTLISYIRVIASLSIILLTTIAFLPLLRPLRRLGLRLFGDFAPLASLVPPEPPTSAQKKDAASRRIRVWRHMLLVILGAVEAGVWMGVTGSAFLQALYHGKKVVDVLASAGMVLVWVRPLLIVLSAKT